MILRIRFLLPRKASMEATTVSVIAHGAMLAAVIWFGAQSATGSLRGSGQPVLRVDLTTTSRPKTRPKPAKQQLAPKPEPKVEEPAPKLEEPVKAETRREAQAPTAIVEKPEGTTAQPETLPQAEPQPETADSREAGPSGVAPDAGGEDALEGPVAEGVGGIAFEEGFQADWYANLLVTRVRSAWSDRPILPRGAEPQRVVISFRIRRNGEMFDPRVDVPSGYGPLDQSAKNVLSRLKRLPPLPRSYEKDSLRARMVLVLEPPN